MRRAQHAAHALRLVRHQPERALLHSRGAVVVLLLVGVALGLTFTPPMNAGAVAGPPVVAAQQSSAGTTVANPHAGLPRGSCPAICPALCWDANCAALAETPTLEPVTWAAEPGAAWRPGSRAFWLAAARGSGRRQTVSLKALSISRT